MLSGVWVCLYSSVLLGCSEFSFQLIVSASIPVRKADVTTTSRNSQRNIKAATTVSAVPGWRIKRDRPYYSVSLLFYSYFNFYRRQTHTHTTQHNTRWLTGIEERIYSYIRIKKRDKKGNIGITKGRRGETERERREKIMLSHLKWFRLKVYKGEGV